LVLELTSTCHLLRKKEAVATSAHLAELAEERGWTESSFFPGVSEETPVKGEEESATRFPPDEKKKRGEVGILRGDKGERKRRGGDPCFATNSPWKERKRGREMPQIVVKGRPTASKKKREKRRSEEPSLPTTSEEPGGIPKRSRPD